MQSYDRSTELISIHALREEGDFWMLSYCCCKTISIHALREEGDHPAGILPDSRADFYPRPPRGGRQRDVLGTFATPGISIHALREEGDPMLANLGEQAVLFLSTPSARRATSRPFPSPVPSIYFYPRPPRGGRRRRARQCRCIYKFLSTPSARRATRAATGVKAAILFLSTPSARRATLGSDEQDHRPLYFYPRPPRGGRLALYARQGHTAGFLSTPSARRATAKTETKSLFSNKLYNILHEFRRALIYNGSKNYPNHAK